MNRTSKSVLWMVLLLTQAGAVHATVEGTVGPVLISENPNLAGPLPDTPESEILISRDQYVISYNKNRRAPNWVACHLESSQIGSAGRTNQFQQDADLEKYLQQTSSGLHAVGPNDYEKSCFDRGHQAPSGDRTDTVADNAMTFMMSNMIPQTPYLNRVIWEQLESYTRDLVQNQGKTVYVMAGPIYDIDFGKIGPEGDIPVPSKDFKIIYVLDAGQTAADITPETPSIAVIMPNVLKDGSVPVANTANCGGGEGSLTSDDWKQYETTIADIESKTSLTFH